MGTLLALGVAGCAPTDTARHLGQAPVAAARCRSENGLPDRARTAGAAVPGATRRIVCAYRYSRRVRPPLSYTEPLKRRLLDAYGDAGQPLAAFQLDLISISIGGAPRTLTNLWPERSGSIDGYQAKHRVEPAIARALCSGKVNLHAAQDAIARDWRTALTRLHLPPLPPTAKSSTGEEER